MKEPILLKEIQLFLTRYCQQERHLSRLTVLSYRDTMKLFLNYLHGTRKISLSKIELSELTYELVSEFLIHLEKKRGISVSTRNQRLCAIHSFLRYLLFKYPTEPLIAKCSDMKKSPAIAPPRNRLSGASPGISDILTSTIGVISIRLISAVTTAGIINIKTLNNIINFFIFVSLFLSFHTLYNITIFHRQSLKLNVINNSVGL